MKHTDHRSTPRFRVLVVDDDKTFVARTLSILGDDYDVGAAYNTVEALSQIDALKPDVVLLDVILQDGIDGLAALERIRSMNAPPEVIMLTGVNAPATVVQAIRSGAFHYVSKSSPISELANLINKAALAHHYVHRLAAMDAHARGHDFLVFDPAMQRVIKEVERVAPTESNVLIIGESGTGKELVAARIHARSRRAKGALVAINCAAVSEGLIESELFGHVRGAFTTALSDHPGCFAQAAGGTLFLDEIGLAPLPLQMKLLRVLESREYKRVGGSSVERADVRIVAASSSDLEAMAAAGTFKAELLYRLNVFTVVVPPLRRRSEDILPMAENFLAMYGAQMGRRGLSFAPPARAYLERHEWRGNVRDLKNRIERAVILAEGAVIPVELLLPSKMDQSSPPLPWRLAAKEFKLEYFARLMQRFDDSVTNAARSAGMSREALSRLLRDIGLREHEEGDIDCDSDDDEAQGGPGVRA